jgi:DNA-binding response OmpR family regulator
MSRILVVEQRAHARVAALLDAEGFAVVVAPQLHEAISAIASFQPDLVVVETNVPSTTVLALCGGIRAVVAVPLALVSGPCAERDSVDAFGVGVDSVIIEPVGQHELVARVRALVRRAPQMRSAALDLVTVGPVVLDRARRELSVHGKQIRIPRREFDIAELLMREAGKVVPRQRLIRELWGTVRDTKSLDVQVGRLRARLMTAEGRRRIVTVRGVGFRFLADGDPDLLPVVIDLTVAGAPDLDLLEEEVEESLVLVVEPESTTPDVLEGSASA